MRDKGKRGIAGVLLALLCMWLPCTVQAADNYQENAQFDIHVSYGYENTVKIGRDVSFQVSVRNLGEAFEGKIHLMTAAYEEKDYYSSSVFGRPLFTSSPVKYFDNYGMEKEFALAAGEERTVSFDLPYASCAPYVKIALVSGEETLMEKVMQLSVSSALSEILVGVLTDVPEYMQYLDGVHLEEYSNVSTSAVMLGEGNFARTRHGLDMLDVLMVQDFDFGRLDGEQLEAMRLWLLDGGILVQGADFSEETAMSPTGVGELAKTDYGKGVYAVCETSLCMAGGEVSGGTTGLVEELFLRIYGEEALMNLDAGGLYFGSDDFWSSFSRLNSMDAEHVPQMFGYVLILGVYVVLVGPVTYLVLKRFRVRKYLWGCVGMLAVIFSGLMFVMGSSTRFNAPFLNYVRTIRLTEGNADERVEFKVRAPYNEPYSIYVNQAYDIQPLSEIGYFSAQEMTEPDFSRETVRLSCGEEENSLTMASGRAFTEQYFTAEKHEKTAPDAGIEGELVFFDGEMSGTVHNGTEYDLTEAFVFFQNHMVCLGELPAGSSRELSEETLYSYAPNYGYRLLESARGISDGYHRKITEEFLDASWKQSILADYLQEGYAGDAGQCLLVGFADDLSLDLAKDSAYRMYGQTVVCADLPLVLTQNIGGREWEYCPFLTNTAQVVSGNYGAYENVYYSREVILEYAVPEGLADMELSFGEESFFDTEYYKGFSGTVLIYNYRTKAYEEADIGETIPAGKLREYLGAGRTLLVKYQRNSDVQDKAEKLPVLLLKGRRM